LAAVPSIGRATRVERHVAPGAAAAGDLYERYSGQIFGYCLHQLGSREEAEDAVQTTFMNAFRALSRGIVPELESAWLFKIAHNVCLSRKRSSWRRGKVESPNNFEVLQEVVPGAERVSDELIRLQDVLEEMPESQRRAILLREWQGLTYREISAELGLSQAATETLIFRARRALAQGLEQDADTWKKRLRRGADAGGAVACINALLTGGGAATVKVAATALAVATAGVAALAGPAARHSQRAPATRPHATTAHVARHTASTRTFSAASRASLHWNGSSTEPLSGNRGASHPVALPTSKPDATTSAPAANAPAPPPAGPTAPESPTPPPSQPAPPPPAAQTAPAAPSSDHAGDKSERKPQATSPPQTDPTLPPASTAPQQQNDSQGQEDHGNGQHDNGNGNGQDKHDKSDNGNGNGHGSGNK
jgi:RNA polymerase sigma factor (sigma-70 family)